MSKRLIIAVDCDDVLVETTSFLVRRYNSLYGTDVKIVDAHKPNNPDWGTDDKSIILDRLSEIQNSKECLIIKPIEEAVRAIHKLAKTNELHLVTARDISVESSTMRMLDEHFNNCFTSVEHVGKSRSKGEVCRQIKADVLIDDNIKHLISALDHGLYYGGAIHFGDYAWNHLDKLPNGVTECSDWSSVVLAIKDISERIKPIIAVDIDDVLADSARGLIDFSNNMFKTNLDIDDYDEHLMKMWQVDLQESERRLGMFFEMNSFLSYRHKPKALPILKKLKEKYNLIIVTSRRIRAKEDTLIWINRKYPGIFNERDIHHTGFHDNASEKNAQLDKGDILKKLGADYLIDDQLKHCKAAAVLGIKSLLFGDYEWNRDEIIPEGVTRVLDWDEVGIYFDESY